MEIRTLQNTDARGLFLLVKSVYKDSPLSMWFEREPSAHEFEQVFSKKMENLQNGEAIDFVAVSDDKIVGECEILRIGDITGVMGLIVMKELRNRGIASALIDKSMKIAERLGIKCINAEVTKENTMVLDFLSKRGFEIKGIENKSVRREGKPHDVLLLQKEL